MEEYFARDFLRGIGGDAPAPEQQQRREEEKTEEVLDLSLGLSLGGRFGVDKQKGDKLLSRPSSSVAAAVLPPPPPPPVEVPAPPVLSLASWSPSYASLGGDGHRSQGSGALLRITSLPAVSVTDQAAANAASKKRKEAAQILKGVEFKKNRIQREHSLAGSSSRAAPGQENRSSGRHHLARGRPPKYQAVITSRDSLTALGKEPFSAFRAFTEEHSSSSSVLSSGEAIIRRVMSASPLLPSLSLAPLPITAATLGSLDQSIFGRPAAAAAAARANSTGHDVTRRIMQEMPSVYTRGLPNRVDGFLYKYRKADDVRIVCLCHADFLTPSQFVEHAGNGKVANPLRHIVVSATQTL